MKLRLLVTENCNRACEGCCNKQWDLGALPVCLDFAPYDTIMLTGGEPMLDTLKIRQVIARIRRQNADAQIYVYTAMPRNLTALDDQIDGVTLTLHEQADVAEFWNIRKKLTGSLRLNVFDGVSLMGVNTDGWDVREGIEWIENCPLPEDEVFMRLS